MSYKFDKNVPLLLILLMLTDACDNEDIQPRGTQIHPYLYKTTFNGSGDLSDPVKLTDNLYSHPYLKIHLFLPLIEEPIVHVSEPFVCTINQQKQDKTK